MRAALSLVLAWLAATAGPALGQPMVAAQDVLAAITADWNEDGRFDRAVLVAEEGEADLYVFLSEEGRLRLAAHKPGFAWAGAMWGTLPTLALNPAGSLQVVSGNQAIGRSRWQETVTIAYRGGRLVVAGFTFKAYDTLEPGLTRDCDANFLNGRGLLDGAPFAVPTPAQPLTEWSTEDVPPECAAG